MGFGKPISKWTLQETSGTTVADTMSVNTGTATSGNARRFNGTSDYVSFTNQIIPLGAKTIRFKFRRNGLPSTTSIILDNNSLLTTNNGTSVYINSASGYIYFGSMTGSGQRIAATTNVNVCDNKWHEIMFTWDGTVNANGVKVFVDDMVTPVYQGTSTSTETTNATYNLWMGRNANTANQWGGFDIDDLQITNAAMGAGTVAAWWKMDDATNTAMVDSSTNAWAATVSGTIILTSPDSMPIIVSDGAGGYARRFNGRSDRITYINQVLPLGAKNIRFKMRRQGVPSTVMDIVDNCNGGNSSQNGTYIRMPGNGEIQFLGVGGGTVRFNVITSGANICDGAWHDILCTWDGTTNVNGVSIYIDNMTVPAKQGASSSLETVNASYNLTIGATANLVAGTYFEGDLKDIQISVGTGTERTDPKDLQIGDFIAAKYAAVTSGVLGAFSGLGVSPTSFIPPASSATPNGGFYLIYVADDFAGRKILVSDRHVQHSIAWDTINTAGVGSGSGVPTGFLATPYMTSATAPSGTVDASSFTVGNEPYKAFDGSMLNAWVTASGVLTGWLSYQFPAATAIAEYRLAHDSGIRNTIMPKNWTFEGSNDGGTTWVVLDTQSNITWTSITTAGIVEEKSFKFTNSTAYTKYRINISAINGDTTYCGFSEISLIQPSGSYGYATRLLSAGLSATDTDNEWDNYITNSTLNGTIVAGDNNIWNWNGIYSHSSTTVDIAANTSANRAVRGSGSISTWTYVGSAGISTSQGFRPVLIVETFTSLKHLFQDGTDIKRFTSPNWVTVGTAPVTAAMFTANGMSSAEVALANINQLVASTPQLLSFGKALLSNPSVMLTAVPPNKLVLPTGDIDLSSAAGANYFNITANEGAGGMVRMIVSVDSGTTWKTWGSTMATPTWATIDQTTMATVKANGMTAATVNARVRADWDALIGTQRKIRFAYYLEMASSTDMANTDKITMQLDLRGSWKKAIHGTDFDYEYPDNTVLRVNFFANGDYKVNYGDAIMPPTTGTAFPTTGLYAGYEFYRTDLELSFVYNGTAKAWIQE